MRVGGGGNDHNVNRRVLDHLLRGAEGLHTGVVLLGIIVRLRGALDDGIELQLRDLGNEGNVEDLCTEAVANNANVISLASHDECVI